MACKKCDDKGFVIYLRSIDGGLYQYLAHCSCEKGNDYKHLRQGCVDDIFGRYGVNPFTENKKTATAKQSIDLIHRFLKKVSV